MEKVIRWSIGFVLGRWWQSNLISFFEKAADFLDKRDVEDLCTLQICFWWGATEKSVELKDFEISRDDKWSKKKPVSREIWQQSVFHSSVLTRFKGLVVFLRDESEDWYSIFINESVAVLWWSLVFTQRQETSTRTQEDQNITQNELDHSDEWDSIVVVKSDT